MATGMTLYFRMPFPEDNVFFELMYLRASPVFWDSSTPTSFFYTRRPSSGIPSCCRAVRFRFEKSTAGQARRLPRYPTRVSATTSI